MKQPFIYFLGIQIFVSSCGSEKAEEEKVSVDTVAKVIETPAAKYNKSIEGLAIYKNSEMVEYCLLLPLEEYVENTADEEKAQHSFVHNIKKNNEINVKGLLRANTQISIEDYFKNTYEDAELEGKIIQKKELLKNKNCFYSKGYWNNSINELRYIEICWLRDEDVITYYSAFDIQDTTIWNNRLDAILIVGSGCQ